MGIGRSEGERREREMMTLTRATMRAPGTIMATAVINETALALLGKFSLACWRKSLSARSHFLISSVSLALSPLPPRQIGYCEASFIF